MFGIWRLLLFILLRIFYYRKSVQSFRKVLEFWIESNEQYIFKYIIIYLSIFKYMFKHNIGDFEPAKSLTKFTIIRTYLKDVRTFRRLDFQRTDYFSRPEVFLVKGVLKICNKFTGKHLYRSLISVTLQSIFIDITLPHRCSPVNLLHIFRTTFSKNISGWLLPYYTNWWQLQFLLHLF